MLTVKRCKGQPFLAANPHELSPSQHALERILIGLLLALTFTVYKLVLHDTAFPLRQTHTAGPA